MLLLWIGAAMAADWLQLQGTEAEDAALRPWGFVQVLGEGVVAGEPVSGLSSETLAPFNGELANFNRVGGDATYGLSVRRARLGLRGAVPNTEGKVAYLVAAELGDNGLTRLDPVVLTDASLTLSYLPGARLRVGQFKLPLGEEALEMNPIAAEFINFSAATSQLLLENPSADGVYTGGASGFRGVGAQVFDSFEVGPGALSYALMVSDGRVGAPDDARDLTGRLSWSPRVWGGPRDPHREELSLFAFWQEGQRTLADEPTRRSRRGVGVQLQRAGFHARAEAIAARGAIELGTNPPFPSQPVAISADGVAAGGYAFLHYERAQLGGGLRYDTLWRLYDSPADLRELHTLSADLQWSFNPRARVLLDYEHRLLLAPGASADAQAIGDSMGDRVSVMVSAVF